MIKVCGKNFACDECPICEGIEICEDIEHRLEAAAELGVKPQIDRWGCDKVQQRKTGNAYRRQMHRRKHDKMMKIMTYGYNPAAGYVDWDWVNGMW